MKKISKILLSLIVILGFATSVDAASTSIYAYTSGTRYEYIDGLPIYYNQAGGYGLYILNINTHFNTNTYLTNPVEANEGFTYILNNSNVTNNTYKNYYIAQVAILWYQDYLNGTDSNISSNIKNYIASHPNDTVCYYINKLVTNAKNYGNNGADIDFIDEEITFTKNGGYYYSNVIDVVTNNLTNTPSVRMYNAPTSATIINNTVKQTGEGSFQIRIPISSLTGLTNKDFEVYITGNGYNYSYYQYSNQGSSPAIYGYKYSSNYAAVEASMIARIEGFESTNVRVQTIDANGRYISGISYSIYSGDCLSNTCYSNDLVQNFTSSYTYTNLTNVLSSGVYTIVRTSSNINYNLPTKVRIVVENTSNIQTFTIEEGKNYDNYYDDNYYNDNYFNNNNYNDNIFNENIFNDNYYDDNYSGEYKYFTIYNDINDYNNYIKIYKTTGSLVKSYRSYNTNYSLSLPTGNYYIIDSKGILNRLYFRVTSNGELEVKYNDEYTKAYDIDLNSNTYNDNYIGSTNGNNNNNVTNNQNSGSTNTSDKIEITTDVNTTTDVKIDWISNIIDTPITDLSSTVKYIIGAIILSAGLYLVVRNVKKSKNNI